MNPVIDRISERNGIRSKSLTIGNMTKLSLREEQALRFIKRHVDEFGRAPYQSQIAAHLKQNSRGFVCRMLDNMERKGVIMRQWGVPRSIRSVA